MTLPQVTSIFEYWSDHPPLAEMAAAYLGIKPKVKLDVEQMKSIAKSTLWGSREFNITEVVQ